MAHSHAEELSVVCVQCGTSFSTEVWLIVDVTERLDLVTRLHDGTLYDVVCPNGHGNKLDSPLLLFRPGRNVQIIYSPSEQLTDEKNLEIAAAALGQLVTNLGDQWSADWLEFLSIVRRPLLSAALRRELKETPGVEGDGELLSQSLFGFVDTIDWLDSYYYVLEHAELLSDWAMETIDMTLQQLREMGETATAEYIADQTTLLRRAHEVGPAAAWAEQLDSSAAEFREYLFHQELFRDTPADLMSLFEQATNELVRYQTTGQPAALMEASSLADALIHDPLFPTTSSAFRITALAIAGEIDLLRYQTTEQRADLDSVVDFSWQVVAAAEEDAPESSAALMFLSECLAERYALTQDVADIEAAVAHSQKALEVVTIHGLPQVSTLTTLSAVLLSRFMASRERTHADETLAIVQQALPLAEQDELLHPMLLANRGMCLFLRSEWFHLGEPEDLDLALQDLRQALATLPPFLPHGARAQVVLGMGLIAHYWRDGQAEVLQEGLDRLQQSIQAMRPDARLQLAALHTNGRGLLARYFLTGDEQDLHDAIAIWRSLLLHPFLDESLQEAVMASLGIALRLQYSSFGDKAALEEASNLLAQESARFDIHSQELPTPLINLAQDRFLQYQRTGHIAALDQAIDAARAAVTRAGKDPLDLDAALLNLANGLLSRFERLKSIPELDEALTISRQALAMIPANSPRLLNWLPLMGLGYLERYGVTYDSDDLNEALIVFARALSIMPARSPLANDIYSALGTVMLHKYSPGEGLDNLDAAIGCYQQALERTDEETIDRAALLMNLGNGYMQRFQETNDPADLAQAIDALRAATKAEPVQTVLLNAQRALAALELLRGRWLDAAVAADAAADTLQQLLRANILPGEADSWRREGQGIAAVAAYARARMDNKGTAVLALETGQAQSLGAAIGRSRDHVLLARLRGEHPALYEQYTRAAAQYRLSANPPPAAPALGIASPSRQLLRRQATEAQNVLDAAIAAIQAAPGYHALFQPSRLAEVALFVPPSRPLVYLATTLAGTLALIFYRPPGAPPTAEVIWSDLSWGQVADMLAGRERHDNGLLGSQYVGQPHHLHQLLPALLEELGQELMAPLAARLRQLAAQEVTLIPGGRLNLLPLHAATYVVDGQPRLFLDEFTVRFAPSAQIAAECRMRVSNRAAASALLAVTHSQPTPDWPAGLPHAAAEVEAIAALFPGPVMKMQETATPDAVLAVMRGKTHLHFACHAEYQLDNPLASGLLLADGTRLTLAALMKEPLLDRAPLVVLSACQTGLIDIGDLPDEVIGLPTGFLSAGAGGVVGTLWPVNDRSTELLMTYFYTSLVAESRGDPAVALRYAQRQLRWATRADLATHYEQRIRAGDSDAFDAHREIVGRGRADERPYASPYYWAAFTYTGA